MSELLTAADTAILAAVAIQQNEALCRATVAKLVQRGCVYLRPCDCGNWPHPTATAVGRWVCEEFKQRDDFVNDLVGTLTAIDCFVLYSLYLADMDAAATGKRIKDMLHAGLLKVSYERESRVEITDAGYEHLRKNLRGRNQILSCL